MARKSKEVIIEETPVDSTPSVEVAEVDETIEQYVENTTIETTVIEEHKDTHIVDSLVEGEVVQLSGTKYKVSKEGGLTFFDPV